LADAFGADQPARSRDQSLHSQDPLYYCGRLRGKRRRTSSVATNLSESEAIASGG
jgi:hypothetical protein